MLNLPSTLGRWELSALLDALIPLSLLGVAWERSEDPAWMVWCLTLWCGLKLVLRLGQSPWVGLLIGVLLVNLSAVLHPLSVSSPADLILVLLAVAAGLRQSERCWRQSLWILLVLVPLSLPLLVWDRLNENLSLIPVQVLRDWLPQEALRLGKITINRSGHLWGLLSVVAYGLLRFEPPQGTIRRWRRWLAAALALLALALAFATGSRAAFGLPLLLLLPLELLWRLRHWSRSKAAALATGILILAISVNSLLVVPWISDNQRMPAELGRARVARCFIHQSLSSGPSGLMGGQGFDRVSDRCRLQVPPSRPELHEGPPHAHNLFLQALGDQGLLTVLFLTAGVWCILRGLLQTLTASDGWLSAIGLLVTLYLLGCGLLESTLIKTSLQQVLTGYLLAIAWRPIPSTHELSGRSE